MTRLIDIKTICQVLSPETGTRVPKAQTAGAPARRQPLEREANVTTPSLSSIQAVSSPALGGFP